MIKQSREVGFRLLALTELPDAPGDNPRGAPWLCFEFGKAPEAESNADRRINRPLPLNEPSATTDILNSSWMRWAVPVRCLPEICFWLQAS